MKKIGLISLGLLSLILVGCGATNTAAPTTETVMLTEDQQTDAYRIYSDDGVAGAIADGKRVVLNFRASRCPVCTTVSNDILANESNLPSDVVVFETDYDRYPLLKTQYNVNQQTTFVIIDDAGESFQTIETIRSFNDLLNSL